MSRVSIAELSADDCDEFIAAMRASRALHGPWATPPQTREEFGQMLYRTGDDSFVSLLARRHADRAIIGYFNISNIIRGPLQSAYLGYNGVLPYAGNGYMTEALQLVLAYVFGPLGLHRIEANIQPGNAASRALAARCGFVREGFSEKYLRIGGKWRDHERWAINAERWKPR
jgi:[ribosomal protein S5]-alanine N-acetyltransferase